MTTQKETPFQIVVGFDFSDLGKLALAEALGLTKFHAKSSLHVIGVLEPKRGLGPISSADAAAATQVQSAIAEIVHSLAPNHASPDPRCLIHARIGSPTQEILSLAQETAADLIIVGTHGRTGVRRLLVGSVAETVVRNAACPVLVMRNRSTDLVQTAAEEEAFQPDPPCKMCVAQRQATDGADWWCEQHSKPYVRPHRYNYSEAFPQTPDKWSTYNG